MHYGFLKSPMVHSIDPSISIPKIMKTLHVLGYLKSSTTTNLTPNTLNFISLMALCSFDGSFVITNLKYQHFLMQWVEYTFYQAMVPSPRWHLALTSTTTALECIQHMHTWVGELTSL